MVLLLKKYAVDQGAKDAAGKISGSLRLVCQARKGRLTPAHRPTEVDATDGTHELTPLRRSPAYMHHTAARVNSEQRNGL
jgi:hypothetical protein